MTQYQSDSHLLNKVNFKNKNIYFLKEPLATVLPKNYC
jgi:hypothetical protein